MAQLISRMLARKNTVLFLSVLIAIPFLIRIPDLRIVENVDYFANENHRDVIFYKELKSIFDNDEFFIVAFKKQNLFTAANLGLLKSITNDLVGIDGIREIKSLANVNETIGEEDNVVIRQFLETIPEEPHLLEKLRQRAIQNPLYLKNLLSSDGNTAAIVIFLHNQPDHSGFRSRIIAGTRAVLERYKDKTGPVHIAGWTVTNTVLARYMKQDLAVFIPVTYCFIALAVFLFFRNIRLTLVAMVYTSLCVGCTMGLFPMLDITLNNVTTMVPPVVMALALCDTVHIFSHLIRHRYEPHHNVETVYAKVLLEVILPCFLTTLTTFIGFLSLYVSDIPPIREFAIVSSMGILFEFCFAFTFIPAFMLLFNQQKIVGIHNRCPSNRLNLPGFFSHLSESIFRHYRMILTTGILLILVSIWLASTITVDTNLLAYFRSDSPVYQSTRFVEKELAGTNTIDISFKAVEPDAFKQPETLEVIQTLQLNIARMAGVDNTLSLVDFIKDLNRCFHNNAPEFYRIPKNANLISQLLLIGNPDDIQNLINPSFNHARMSVRIGLHSTRDQAELIKLIKNQTQTMDTRGLQIQISGLVLQEVNTISALVRGQVLSLTITAVIIILIIFFVLRSFPLGMLSILPNLFPIVLNFGIMGLFNIPLNTATALISTIAVSIAVDDTIHFLTEFKTHLAWGADIRQAVFNTLQAKGRAIILSSLILAMGFGVMVFSKFVPTMNFGALSAVIMILALLGDTLLLPASAIFFSSRLCIKSPEQRLHG
ncbi:MMPL family transporter [Desulfobacter postgatei]|uniref:efflux RND transporter permease subunit n=1 Tax=Desulfobacter postgatei TaxID=2293 RepID=UPI00259BCDFA|nr:MMPL family transporter [uncultured Desulfobacter sp.]